MKVFSPKLLFFFMIFYSNFLHADLISYKHISISDASGVYESNGPLRFAISIDASPRSFFGMGGTLTVHYKTITSSTAVAGTDYTSVEGDVTFTEDGPTTLVVTVPILNDSIHEENEYVYVTISENSLLYEITDATGYGTIYDDDALPLEITVNNAYVTETDGTANASFYVSLNQPAPTGGLKITYSTTDDTASFTDDYTMTIDSITIPEGSSSGYIYIPIKGDTIPEETEQFLLDLSSCEGTITPQAIGTIYDDDAIKVYVNCNDADEGNTGESNNVACRIYLDKDYPLDNTLDIDYASADGSDPAATLSDNDYQSTSGTVTFSKGDREKIVNIPTIGDDTVEEDELVTLTISGSSYIVTSSSMAEILNDDGDHPTLSFDTSDFSITEGNSSTKTLNFTFTLDAPAEAGSSFDYYTQDNTAEAGSDYLKKETTTYTIPEGDTTVSIPITINGDTDIEEDEAFYLRINNEQNLVVSGHVANGWILNDDGSYPKISFTSTSLSTPEGDSGSKELNVSFTLDQPALADSSFDYYTQDDTAEASNNDYEAISPAQTYTIPEGESSFSIPVTLKGDTDIEEDESFYFKIANLNNIEFGGSSAASITLLNDDGSYPNIGIAAESYIIKEGDSGTHNLQITLTLDQPALAESTLHYYTYDDTATDGSSSTEDDDYVQTTGDLTIPEGDSNISINIPIVGDGNIEPDENFRFYISNAKNMTIVRGGTTITIQNDDEHNEDPFVCDEHMYLSSSKKRGSEETGRMWLHRIDTTYSPFKFEVMDDEGEDRLYNAIAYNPEDNYIYALYYRELLKISKTGKIISQGNVTALPEELDDYQLFAGAIYDNEHYYVSGIGVNTNKIYTINLNDKSVSELTMSQNINIKDFSLSPTGDFLYGIIDGGEFVKINTLTGMVTKIGPAHTGEFDSSFSDKNGRFFANDSEGSGFYEFNTNTGEKAFMSNSQPATYNDGTNCLNAELLFTDYGDAPHDAGKFYGEAWHNIKGGIYLGNKVDHDTQSYSNESATGDDTNGTDDEDGVVLADGSPLEGAYLEDNRTQQLKVTLSKKAYLRIWLDLDIDGSFDNGHDLVYDNQLTAGEHLIDINLPEGLTQNVTTYLRARVSSVPAMDYQGYLKDGEVEDYAIKFGSAIQPLRGVFNIERTNSGSDAINSDERNAWYTQIVGRDFDYSVLFYEEDMSDEKELDNVTVKLELINQESNEVLYTRYAHIKNDPPKSRIDVTLPADDLGTLPATKKAIFRISYGVNGDGSIIQEDCNTDPEICYNSHPLKRTDYAFDNFAIRPENFYVSIADGNQERVNTNSPDEITFAAGYDYNLSIKAIKYRLNYPAYEPAEGYNGVVDQKLDFNSSSSCANNQDIDQNITFNNGIYEDTHFSHNNVGRYHLTLIQDSNWTAIDQNGRDCQEDQSSTSTDPNTPSGCNITEIDDIIIHFQPDHFDLALTLGNLPNSGHPSFIYMSDLNRTYSDVAIQFEGNITAKSATGETTTNFTRSCVATNLLLDLNASTISVEGNNQVIHTTEGSMVNFTRWIRFNHDPNALNLDINNTLPTVDDSVQVGADKFLDDHNGTLIVDIRYNLNKNHAQPINPVEVSFNSMEVNATDANSSAHDPINIVSNIHIPKGHQDFVNNRKNFYFTRVVSDLSVYPRVNLSVSPLIQTPLNVDFYCKTNSIDYCKDRDVLLNTALTGTTREQLGWYLSTKHDAQLDGNVTRLTPNPAIVTISPNPLNDIALEEGENGLVTERFDNCNSPEVFISITTDPVLRFDPSGYTLLCTDNNASQWTGIGKTGNILNVQPKINQSHKIDW